MNFYAAWDHFLSLIATSFYGTSCFSSAKILPFFPPLCCDIFLQLFASLTCCFFLKTCPLKKLFDLLLISMQVPFQEAVYCLANGAHRGLHPYYLHFWICSPRVKASTLNSIGANCPNKEGRGQSRYANQPRSFWKACEVIKRPGWGENVKQLHHPEGRGETTCCHTAERCW